MGSVQIALFRSLVRTILQYEKRKIPLLGIAEFQANQLPSNLYFCPVQACKYLFRVQTRDKVEGGFNVLRRLNFQLQHLCQADEDAKQAFAEWWQLFKDSASNRSSAVQQVELVEQAMKMIHRMSLPMDSLFEEEMEKQENIYQQSQAEFTNQYGALQVRLQTMISRNYALSELELLKSIKTMFFEEYNFRTPPFEWVYDGLAPLIIADVMKNRKGLPFSVGIIIWGACNRAGIACNMCKVSRVEGQSIDVQNLAKGVQNLPVYVAAKHIGRSLQATPEPECWLLQFSTSNSKLFMDLQNNGQIYNMDEMQQIYHLQNLLQDEHLQCLALLRESCRLVIMAHTRRGESDEVAKWLYQLMAMDLDAQEWEYVLQAKSIGK
eukprot:TRINITY_DN1341_c0_g1_i2.p1 TRINITY_DN1341_c0_g1~~TRINITY_DN1341_c0_g1_i2.p1  ORF type:complete len:415 (+),score=24.66 TRINITY_DN1341_c0_g1_i2:109-1245(+)